MNIETFQPRGSNVLVRRLKLTKEETGGIIVPGDEYGNYAFAEVLAKGPGNSCVSHTGVLIGKDGDTRYMSETADLQVGDTILMLTGMSGGPLSGRPKVETTLPFTVAGEKVELLGEGKIIAIITKSK